MHLPINLRLRLLGKTADITTKGEIIMIPQRKNSILLTRTAMARAFNRDPVIDCMVATTDYERILCRRKQSKIGMDSFPVDIYNDLLRHYLLIGKIRNAIYLICMANWGMRCGDVCSVRFCHLFTERGTFKESFTLSEGEQKTGKQNIYYNNDAVKQAITMYLKAEPRKLYEYIFCSESNNQTGIKLSELDKNAPDIVIAKPMSTTSAENIIKDGLVNIGIHTENGRNRDSVVNCSLKLNTHSLRKMFSEIFYITGCELCDTGELELNPTMLEVLKEKFMHSKMSITRRYNQTMEKAFRTICLNTNIGLDVLEQFGEEFVNNAEIEKESVKRFHNYT